MSDKNSEEQPLKTHAAIDIDQSTFKDPKHPLIYSQTPQIYHYKKGPNPILTRLIQTTKPSFNSYLFFYCE